MRSFPAVLAFSICCAALAQGWDAGELSAWVARDDAAAPVTQETLLANDRFWPYQVAAAERMESGGRTILAGSTGVLIRVESEGVARVDFGRDGIVEMPIAATDLVERANRVRTGELEKEAPNLAWAIGPRLIDASAEPPAPVSFLDVRRAEAFVTVFADPASASFDEIAQSLAPLRDHPRVMTVLLAQGLLTDAGVYARLRAVGWRVPYLLGHLGAPYTRTLLSGSVEPPAVALQTAEGRLLFESPWNPEAASQLRAALEAAFPAVVRAEPSPTRHGNATRGTP
jgi:hypothetical protein